MNMKPAQKLVMLGLTIATAACVASQADAHSGRTDATGCHVERATGRRHCHGGSGSSGSSSGGSSGSYSPSSGSGSDAPARNINDTDGNIIIIEGVDSGSYDYESAPSSTPGSSSSSSSSTLWTVSSVSDGDTLQVNRSNETQTVRLACIDAPEMEQQPFGASSKTRLQQILPAGTAVSLRVVDTDQYGRTVAEVFRNLDSLNVNLALLQDGAAVAYRQYLSNCDSAQYLQAEQSARQQGRSFWSQVNPVMPWDYRRQ